MAFNDIERKRIERAVKAFMAKRRPPPEIRDQLDLGYRIEGYSVELFEIRPQWNDPTVIRQHSFAKTTYVKSKDLWKLYWMRADLKWHVYPPAAEVQKIEEVFEIVVNDENCCFFG